MAFHELKTGGHYSNERVFLAIEQQLPTHDAMFAAVTLLPQRVAIMTTLLASGLSSSGRMTRPKAA